MTESLSVILGYSLELFVAVLHPRILNKPSFSIFFKISYSNKYFLVLRPRTTP